MGMGLSNDLISQFVKITKDDTNTKKETFAYGTVVEQDNKKYVQLDGSKILTPISNTSNIGNGDRVTVMIKNHTAMVTGNLTSPSARIITKEDGTQTVENLNVDELLADNVTIKNKLSASEADISELQAKNVTITNKISAAEGDIANLKVSKIDATTANAKFATIENLDTTNGKVYNLETTYANVDGRLSAAEAVIDDLDATYATIGELNAAKGDISSLESDVADIDTLIFGSATGDTIQTSFANAVIAQLGDAQIKSAMIESVSAGKITAGDIITNNVRVKSEDGKLLISDETIQISDVTRVRVQIGKDAANDYSINIWDADGNLMFSKGGITDSAIKEAIIRNDMISDTANIAAHKLDIDSLFEEINNDGSNTIKSTKVYLDEEGQTLDVAFKSLTTDVNDMGETVSSQGTQISAVQGQIAGKIWQQDIDTAKGEMSTQYSALEQEIDSITTTVASHTSLINKKANSLYVNTISDKVSTLEQDLDGFKTTVSDTYTTKTEFNDLEIGGRNLVQVGKIESNMNVTTTKEFVLRGAWAASFINAENLAEILEPDTEYTVSYELELIERTDVPTPFDMRTGFMIYRDGVWIELGNQSFKEDAVIGDVKTYTRTFKTPSTWNGEQLLAYSRRWTTEGSSPVGYDGFIVRNFKIEKGNKPTDWTPAPEDLENRVSAAETKITQNTESITSVANRTTVVENKFNNYSTTEQMNSAIQQKADSITSTVSETYATNTALDEATKNRLRRITIDLTGTEYDQDTYYPVVGNGIPYSGYRTFQVNVQLDSYSNPTWSTHDAGFSCNLTARMKAAGWGTVAFGTMGWIDDFSFVHCDKMPVYISQLTNWSVPVLYMRGGGRYYVYVDYECNWEIVTTSYDASGQVAEPTSTPSNYSNLVNNWTDHSNLETARSEIIQLSDRITANVTETTNLGTRMSTVEQTASGLTVKLDNMEIGGRNLCRYSTNIQVNSTAEGLTSSTSTDGYLQITASSGNANWVSMYLGGYYTDIENALSEGDNFVISFTMRSSDATVPPTVYIKPGIGYYAMKGTLSSDWSTVWYAGTWIDDGSINPHFGFSNLVGTYEIKNCKIEKGTMYTDWTPAPEDLEARITNADNAATAAAKTATNYLNFSTSGLVVGDMTASTLGKNVLIDSDSVDIRNGTTTLASFGANTIYLGKNSTSSIINLCNGSATMKAVDDTDFRIYTDRRLVMAAYDTMLLDCWRDLTHQTRVSLQSADPDDASTWGGISCSVYQDSIKNTFDISGNTVEFKITDGTTTSRVCLDEGIFKVYAGDRIRLNSVNTIQIAEASTYKAGILLGNSYGVAKSINCYWSDGSIHDFASNSSNGQTSYFGPGDIGEATTTNLRGKYVRLYAHDGGGVYLGVSGSTAVTSDRNLKTDILDIDDKYIDFFDRLRPITYKYNDGHRDHVGFIAQEVEEALIASGLTTEQFAGLIIENDVALTPNYDSSLSDEENAANETHYDTLYSLRYEEFISILVKKVQSLQEQINQLRSTS